jgi:hypothetical protein
MKKLILISLILPIFLVDGCNPISSSEQSHINISTSLPVINSSETVFLEPTSLPPKVAPAGKECYFEKDFQEESDLLSNLPGKLILQQWGEDQESLPKKIALEYLPKDSIPGNVSPDGKHVSYVVDVSKNNTKGYLYVDDYQGKKIEKLLPSSLSWFSSWLNDQEIVFQNKPLTSEITILQQLTINPFSGETQQLPAKFPGLKPTLTTAAMNFYDKDMVFSPDKKYVAYMSTSNYPDVRFVLWDIKNNKVIAYLKAEENYGANPIWSSDSEKVFFPISHDPSMTYDLRTEKLGWYEIRTDGTITQLTDFSQMQKPPIIRTSSISPDGKKIAFWWQTYQENNPEYNYSNDTLSILDLRTNTISNFCGDTIIGDPSIPVWSPDSRYITTSSRYYQRDGNPGVNTTLIDTVNNWYGKLFEHAKVVGWMVN